MLPSTAGSFRLFRLFGIDVWLHWSWIFVAYLQFQLGGDRYSNPIWHVATYLALFAIVLLHEFGHSLACKSVGGKANQIILWPLGGIAFIQPPRRPGAVLWSIAAGPLVNVLLVPVTLVLLLSIGGLNLDDNHADWSDLELFAVAVASINIMLLLFNILPVYPLDGGQIVQAILWFFIDEMRSLRIVAFIGMVIASIGGAWAFWTGDWWLMFIAFFVGWRAYDGYRLAGLVAKMKAEYDGYE